jgi:signal transduction histidine kinase
VQPPRVDEQTQRLSFARGRLRVDTGDERRAASRNTGRLRKLVEDLLLVSELDAGELEFEFDTVDFRDLGQESVESARPQAMAGGISLELSAESAMRLNGDRVAEVPLRPFLSGTSRRGQGDPGNRIGALDLAVHRTRTRRGDRGRE